MRKTVSQQVNFVTRIFIKLIRNQLMDIQQIISSLSWKSVFPSNLIKQKDKASYLIANTIPPMQTELQWQRTLPPADFITNLRYDEPTDAFLFIHEKPFLNLTIGTTNIDTIQQASKNNRILQFESNIYDSIMVGNAFIVSNRNMPVRLYSPPKEEDKNSLQWISFLDKKPNSQQYLFPLQFAKLGEVVVGGGKKFMSQYDCVKHCVAQRFKEMNKRYISSVEVINGSSVIAGQFNGELSFIDLRTQESGYTMKPHFDLVTRIKRVPQSDCQIITMARKDNFIYLWDYRMLDNFLNCFEQPMYGNQRTGLDISNDGKILYLGSQNGKIMGRSILSSEIVLQYQANMHNCISSLCSIGQSIIFAVGQRDFPLDKSILKGGSIGCVSTK